MMNRTQEKRQQYRENMLLAKREHLKQAARLVKNNMEKGTRITFASKQLLEKGKSLFSSIQEI